MKTLLPFCMLLITILSACTNPERIFKQELDELSQVSYNRYNTEQLKDKKEFLNPFRIEIDPMERLLLINIENDPDSLYIGFEPQVFDDDINGKGLLIIAWRTDGKVDVYHQPTLSPDPDKFDIAGKGLANIVERELKDAYFEVTEPGAQARAEFRDIHNRLIELHLTEYNNRTRKPFGLLAPMGMAAENPSALPLVLLHDFYFVRRSNTELSVRIDGREHKPDTLPMPIDFSRMYFARYSPDPVITTLNPAFDGRISPTPLDEGDTLDYDDHQFTFSLHQGRPELQRLSRSIGDHTIALDFSPSFPNLLEFYGSEAAGQFVITVDPSIGEVRGEYKVTRTNNQFMVEMIPSGGWEPNERKLSLRFLYRVVPTFKSWPSTYRWTASIEYYNDDDEQYLMKSNWERTERD